MNRVLTLIEVEKGIEEWREASIGCDQMSARRRRVVLFFDEGHAHKALGYKTQAEFAQKRLGLGLRAYQSIIKNAVTEQDICHKVPAFAKENVRDAVLTNLQKFAEKDCFTIVRKLLEQRREARKNSRDGFIPAIKGDHVRTTAEALELSPTQYQVLSSTESDQLFGHDASTETDRSISYRFSAKTGDIIWKMTQAKSRECGKDLTPEEFLEDLFRQLETEKKIPASEKRTIGIGSVFCEEGKNAQNFARSFSSEEESDEEGC